MLALPGVHLGFDFVLARLLRQKRRRHADQHERRHGGIAIGPDEAPIDAEIFEISDEGHGAGRRDKHADAVGRHEIGHAGGLGVGRQIFDAEGVDDDVLRGRGRSDDHRGESHHQRRVKGSRKPRNTIAAMSRSCDSTSQPRRWPSALPSSGTSKASTIGAHKNLIV